MQSKIRKLWQPDGASTRKCLTARSSIKLVTQSNSNTIVTEPVFRARSFQGKKKGNDALMSHRYLL